MKVSYSKLLVQGVIATTLLMSMSCQKKGSARGVQPNTATKTAAPTDAAKEENKNIQKEGLGNIPEPRGQTVVTSGDATKVSLAADIPDADAEVVAATPSDDAAKASSTTKKETEAVKATTKTTPAATVADSKVCSEAIVKSETQVKSLASKILEADKLSTTSEKDRIANYTAYQQLCLDWAKQFETEKIKSCEIDGKAREVNSFNHTCIKYALSLKDLTGKENTISASITKARNERMAQLRAAKLVVSDEAKEMFNKENKFWKMFLVDGELQTDSAKLTDALKANKVVCTIAVPALDKYTHAQNVILSITAATDLMATDEADPVKAGVELAIRIKASDKDTAAEKADEKSVMLCSNLDSKNMNTAALAKALGKHIAVEAKVESKDEPVKQN
jgi:hypothetical protein